MKSSTLKSIDETLKRREEELKKHIARFEDELLKLKKNHGANPEEDTEGREYILNELIDEYSTEVKRIADAINDFQAEEW